MTIVTAVMNRSEILRGTLTNWVALDFIDEIIVVDWSSEEPFVYGHDKVKVYRVEGEPQWSAGPAFNLAVSLTDSDVVMKSDVDYVFDERIKKFLDLAPRTFCRGDYRLAKEPNDRYIQGLCIVRKEDFNAIGGYTEINEGYGWEDSDLYLRLVRDGCKETCLSVANGVYHKPHDHSLRTVNYTTNMTTREALLANQTRPTWTVDSKRIEWLVTDERTITRKEDDG